jgi:hypothetical protein
MSELYRFATVFRELWDRLKRLILSTWVKAVHCEWSLVAFDPRSSIAELLSCPRTAAQPPGRVGPVLLLDNLSPIFYYPLKGWYWI